MPNLTRAQAAEQMNRLFPGALWEPDDFHLFRVQTHGSQSAKFLMWLPLRANDMRELVRYRANLPANVLISLEQMSADEEASVLHETESLAQKTG